jgi:ABC-type lipoprotein export system ATPase subunit
MVRQLMNKNSGETIAMLTHNAEAARYYDRVVHARESVVSDGEPGC